MSDGQCTPEANIDRALALMRDGATLRGAAAAAGLSPVVLRDHIRRRGLDATPMPSRGGHCRIERIRETQVSTAIDLIRAGASLASAAAEVGMHAATLNAWLHRRGLSVTTLRPPLKPRADAPAYILQPEQIEEAIARVAAGETVSSVARSYGVSRQALHQHLAKRGLTVQKLRTGRTRTDVHSTDA